MYRHCYLKLRTINNRSTMSNYNRYNYKHAKRHDNFGFSQPGDIDNKVPMKYLYSEKNRDQATIKVTFNEETSKNYVHIFKDSTDEKFLDTLQDFKSLLINYLAMLRIYQQVTNTQFLFKDCLRGESLKDCFTIMQ